MSPAERIQRQNIRNLLCGATNADLVQLYNDAKARGDEWYAACVKEWAAEEEETASALQLMR